MRELEIGQVLSQLRSLASQAGAGVAPPLRAPGAAEAAQGGFGAVLGRALENVNGQQLQAQRAATAFELGQGDLATTMLSLQKAQVSFRAAAEVRNKLVSAYQEIMNMPV